MTAVTYTNYTNLDARFSTPYQHGHRLVRGHTGTVDADGDITAKVLSRLCEVVFARHNRDDRPDGQLCPSMSVGDVVVFGESAFSVDSVGFVAVDLDPADLIVDRTWAEMI
jgi:hypothetical protein